MNAEDAEQEAADYVLGVTNAAEREAARGRIAADPAFAAAVAAWERRLAPLAAATRPQPPPAHLLQSIDRRIDGLSAPAAGPPGTTTTPVAARKWKPIGPGLSVCVLSRSTSPPRQTLLLRCEPGAVFPDHDHHGDEEILVLEGDFVMDGLRLGPGDHHFAPKGCPHPAASTRTGCLLLVTAAL